MQEQDCQNSTRVCRLFSTETRSFRETRFKEFSQLNVPLYALQFHGTVIAVITNLF